MSSEPARPGNARIPDSTYGEITALVPILCVDVIVRDGAGAYLLVKRANEPRKGEWWVVGGRVLRDESLVDAAARKVREELGIDAGPLTAVGYYEEIAPAGIFGPEHGTHGVSVVFETQAPDIESVELDSQSVDWCLAEALPSDFRVCRFEVVP